MIAGLLHVTARLIEGRPESSRYFSLHQMRAGIDGEIEATHRNGCCACNSL